MAKRAPILIFIFATMLFGCDQLTATVQGVSILTETPRLSEIEGLPAGLAGALADAASEVELGVVLALAALTERESVTDTSTPEPLSGAQVTLEGPNAVAAQLRVGGLLADSGEIDEALQHLERFAAAQPRHTVDMALGQGEILSSDGRPIAR